MQARFHWGSAIVGALAVTIPFLVLSFQQPTNVQRIRFLTPDQEEILSHMSIVHLDDGQGGTNKTIRYTGVNVQIVNGLGSTATTNGLGNLIVGYNELRDTPAGDDRSGSHNAVVGRMNSYGSYGGVVLGDHNAIMNIFATVTGGHSNLASGIYSMVAGGFTNVASANASNVLGGSNNETLSPGSVVVGGTENTAGDPMLSSGHALVVGGDQNVSDGPGSIVVGGSFNHAIGQNSVVVSGNRNETTGETSAILGGDNNSATANAASVGGGLNRSATDVRDWAAGSLYEND